MPHSKSVLYGRIDEVKIANGFNWLATILSGKIYPKEMEFCDNYHDFPMKFLVFWLISANNFDQE